MLGKRLINSNDAGAACTTDTNDYPTTNVAYYKMSSAADEKGTYNGTATNVNFNAAGKFGNAGEFNGSSSVIDFSQPLLINTFSVSFWINTLSTASQRILGNPYGGAGDYGWNIRIQATTGHLEVEWSANGTNPIILDTATSVTDGGWHHIVATWDEGSQKIYIDNNEEASSTNASDQYPTTDTFKIGANWNNTEHYNGLIDQIRIFDSALNASQVTQLYEEIQCVPTIVPTDYFNTVLYTGDGTSSNAITGVGFEPNLTWIKDRFAAAGHWVNDSVRGAGKGLMTQSTGAEITSLPELMSSFDSDGFTVGYISNNTTNFLNNSYVAWNWKAGGAAVSNTDGIITSQVSANVDAGFSIVKYTGNLGNATMGHGLDEAPELVIYKSIDNSRNWMVQAEARTNTSNYLHLNLSDAYANYPNYFHTTTDETIGIQVADPTTNANEDYIAYCFHSVDGFSKIGSYVGNNPTSSTVRYIYLGFRPAFVMIKNTTTTGPGWNIYDNKRPNATSGSNIFANSGNAEADYSTLFEMTSTGFKLKSVNTNTNFSTNNFIFMAFVEEVFVPDNFFNDNSTVATYKLNGDSGDDSGNGYEGTASNITYAAGKFDEAANFNGTSSSIQTGIQQGSNPFTWSVWLKPNDITTSQYAIAVYNGANYHQFYIGLNGSNYNINCYNGTLYSFSTSAVLNEWAHLVLTYDGTGMIGYFNGVALGARKNFTALSLGTQQTLLGGVQNAGNTAQQLFYNGSIDQVRIFNKALDSGEVNALYNE